MRSLKATDKLFSSGGKGAPNGLEMRYQGTTEYHRTGQAMQVDCGSYVPGSYES